LHGQDPKTGKPVGGIGKGELTLICGKTSTGKTCLVSQIIAKYISESPDHFVVVYSGEQRRGELKFSIFRQLAGSRMKRIGPGEYDIPDEVAQDIKRVIFDQIVWLDTKDDDGHQLPQAEKHTHLKNEIQGFVDAGAGMIVKDNLMTDVATLIGSKELRTTSDLERQSYIGSWLEELAKDNNIYVILVCHYRKDGTDKGVSSDGPSSILGSSSVPNSAGYIIEYSKFTDKEVYGDPKHPDEYPGDPTLKSCRRIKIWKNRGYGDLETKGFKVRFDPASTRIWSDPQDKEDSSFPWEERAKGSLAGDCDWEETFKYWEDLEKDEAEKAAEAEKEKA
jgi:hypothetical protein